MQLIYSQCTFYFTGSTSAAEGLDLPGSDQDFMFDINDKACIKVIQVLDESPDISSYRVFLMCTEHVHAGLRFCNMSIIQWIESLIQHFIE